MLSSHDLKRHTTPVDAIRGASELELRRNHVDAMLGSSFMGMWVPLRPQPLTACQRQLLAQGLQRAIHLCNRLADTAAHGNMRVPGPHHGTASVPPRPRHEAGSQLPSQVRSAQIACPGSLQLEDLSWLYCLVEAAGGGFVRTRKYEAMKAMVGNVISAGPQELKEWETGKEGSLPDLRMSLLDAARSLLGDQDDAPAMKLMSMARRMMMAATT